MSDLAASVRARLLNVAKAQGADFNQVLVRFALERILYRLSQSEHADRFLLKGALLFTLWYDMPHRATRDADLLGFGASDLESVAQTFRDIGAAALIRAKRSLQVLAGAGGFQRLVVADIHPGRAVDYVRLRLMALKKGCAILSDEA